MFQLEPRLRALTGLCQAFVIFQFFVSSTLVADGMRRIQSWERKDLTLSVKSTMMCLHYTTFLVFIVARITTFIVKYIFIKRLNFLTQNWKIFYALELISTIALDLAKVMLLVIFNHMCSISMANILSRNEQEVQYGLQN